jgi:hypothetical protein
MKSMLTMVLGLACLVVCATTASASARLVSVVATGDGCLAGPNGGSVQFWEVQPGKEYRLTIDHVTDCANGGTDATIGVRLNSSSAGNTDRVATRVSDGVYEFTFTPATNAACTMPIFYCTTPGMSNTGLFVRRFEEETFQAHLRMATFGPLCSNPTTIDGNDCRPVPVRSRTWAQVKRFYR